MTKNGDSKAKGKFNSVHLHKVNISTVRSKSAGQDWSPREQGTKFVEGFILRDGLMFSISFTVGRKGCHRGEVLKGYRCEGVPEGFIHSVGKW